MNYKDRLEIPINGSNEIVLYSKTNKLISYGYLRCVIGKRGPYIEFDKKNFFKIAGLEIPYSELWRLSEKYPYYIEYRIYKSSDNIKVYFQKRLVYYADYKIGKFYISAFDLCFYDSHSIIKEK